jgi:glycosyltransferase involved in cell wall biosynthesis
VQALDDLGYFVTVYGTSAVAGSTRAARADVPRTVEVITEPGSQGLTAFFGERRGFYDRIIVSRAHNLDLLRARLGPPTGWCGGARLVYDAEAIAAFRDVERRRLSGQQVGEAEIARLVRAEASLTVGVDTVLAVSPSEQQALLSAGCTNVHVVGHGVPVAPTERPFSRRKGILFVGAFHELSPNADAVLWFARQVLPRIRDLVDQPVEFTVVGPDPPADILALRGPGIDIRGGVRDLEPFYDAARVFVASTRFAAGIPLKVIHAAAAGVPVVATGLLGRQLGWTGGRDLLIADEPDAFASACASLFTDSARWHEVRSAALARVQTDFSPRQFRAQLERALA